MKKTCHQCGKQVAATKKFCNNTCKANATAFAKRYGTYQEESDANSTV